MYISLILPILVMGVGAYLLVKLRFFPILHPVRTSRRLITSLSDKKSAKSLSLALAGTLGVGNIFGVAAGIIIGGAGSVFWLFISSFFAMIIKYAETVLSFDTISEEGGGLILALRSVFIKKGRLLSFIYALLCLILALFMGAAIQSAALCEVASISLEIHSSISALVLSLLVIPALFYGTEKTENITSILIPLTTIIYILICFLVILLNISKLPGVIFLIISSAFSPLSIGGGVLTFVSLNALKEGFARGILSNEAGAGTSSLAHTRAGERHPSLAGLYGMSEVFFDTTLLCILTALAVLTSVPDPQSYQAPMSLVNAAFVNALGDWSSFILLFCIFAFAYSTVICWYYYGSQCCRLLFSGKISFMYSTLFIFFIFAGSFIAERSLIYVTDITLLLMSTLCLLAIIKKADRIKELSADGNLI